MTRLIGIDFGTTNSCIAFMDGESVTVVPQADGGAVLPSIVARSEQGEWLVGNPAKRQAMMNPLRTIYGIKRLIGRKAKSDAIARLRDVVPFEIVPGANGDASVRIDDQISSPQEIAARILEEIKAAAKEYTGEAITEAVITVPASFNDIQRQAVKDAMAIAGMEVRRIINEPTAAALAYGVHQVDDEKILAVFDLGGGTFDVTILRHEAGVFEVLATSGDTLLGGDDFDQVLIQHLIDTFKAEHGIDLSDDPAALQRLKTAAETAKLELSSALSTRIALPFICKGPDGPLHLEYASLKRSFFEDLTAHLLERLTGPCLDALQQAEVSREEIDEVILVGGMTRMPAVRAKASDIFGREPLADVDPDEIVAMGAAVQSALLEGGVREMLLLDVTPAALGIRTIEGWMSVIVPRNAKVPTSARKQFSTTVDGQEFVIIEVYQGQGERAEQNTHLGSFVLEGLPRRPAGEVVVEVDFRVNADGMLVVTAAEATTGQNVTVNMRSRWGLTEQQVRDLAEIHREAQG